MTERCFEAQFCFFGAIVGGEISADGEALRGLRFAIIPLFRRDVFLLNGDALVSVALQQIGHHLRCLAVYAQGNLNPIHDRRMGQPARSSLPERCYDCSPAKKSITRSKKPRPLR